MNDLASSQDSAVRAAISHWGPRFVSNGITLTDFEEVTAAIPTWSDWCSRWSERARTGLERFGADRMAFQTEVVSRELVGSRKT